jgi:hypothetical protein
LAATSFDQVGRAAAAVEIVSLTADLMRLGQQLLDLDASVIAASCDHPKTGLRGFDQCPH